MIDVTKLTSQHFDRLGRIKAQASKDIPTAHPRWHAYLKQLAVGKLPDQAAIGFWLVQLEQVPRSIRLYVAGLLSGNIKRPSEPPPRDPFYTESLRDAVEVSVKHFEELYDDATKPNEKPSRRELVEKRPPPRGWVIKQAALCCGVSASTIRDIIGKKMVGKLTNNPRLIHLDDRTQLL